ncbi:MAG TPA: aminotransferase class I/II-fold pyridoxal phosphate-dependent enzyme [Vicinamibacterales bacterium]|nr:aminotransferase class I/II-fold pyridoxal phosphate-dependent enzyme [Vicinamibacterales bacterium]
MEEKNAVSRRKFVGGLAAALGYVSTGPNLDVFAQGRGAGQAAPGARRQQTPAEYDALAKLANNENNWGIPDSVMEAMEGAWKYAGRYGYPDPGIDQAIAEYDGIKPENIMLGAGSGEILKVVGVTFLQGGKKVLGVTPSYMSVYSHATSLESEAITMPLTKDHRQDIGQLIDIANKRQNEIGFVYIVNPNNPTGVIVTKDEVKQLIEGIPADMPVLLDEAYHHYVDDPAYATGMPYVNQGRPVIVARTFSKIAGMAALRIGYAAAPTEILQKMRPYSTGSVNVLARYGAVATLKDPKAMSDVKQKTKQLRDKTSRELRDLGYEVIPSQTNFFMVGLRREVQPVIAAFREEGVLVGRPFPPMTQHLRVSIGTAEEMDRFMVAFKKVMARPATTTAQQG